MCIYKSAETPRQQNVSSNVLLKQATNQERSSQTNCAAMVLHTDHRSLRRNTTQNSTPPADRCVESTEPAKPAGTGRGHSTNLGTAPVTGVRVRCDHLLVVWRHVAGHCRCHRPGNLRQNPLPHPPVPCADACATTRFSIRSESADTSHRSGYVPSPSCRKHSRSPAVACNNWQKAWPVSFPTRITPDRYFPLDAK
jgi:hypothetical protein